MDTSIEAPTVIYQSQEFQCADVGCSCSYSNQGVALDAAAYTESVEDAWTSVSVTDPSLNGLVIDVKCDRNAEVFFQ